jgi:hypothetical protein
MFFVSVERICCKKVESRSLRFAVKRKETVEVEKNMNWYSLTLRGCRGAKQWYGTKETS